LAILPSCVNKFARENMFNTKLNCLIIVIRVKLVKKTNQNKPFLLPERKTESQLHEPF
jgi:hypothetical protein